MTQIISLSILFPILFQLIIGFISIFKKNRITFFTICSISIILQIIFSIIVFYTHLNIIEQREIRCMNPMIGVVGASFICFLILFLLILIQSVIKYFYNKKNANNTKP